MIEELIAKLEAYLNRVEKNYPFDRASLKGFLEWLKEEKEKNATDK